jgi:uncharacterized protein (DUF885 family)
LSGQAGRRDGALTYDPAMTERAPSSAAAAQILARLAAEAWDGSMAAFPLYATSLGDRRHLTQLSANDAGAEEREAARVRDLIDRTTAVAADDLTPPDRVTRLALLDTLAYELGLAESGIASWTVDPLDGPQVQFLNVEAYQPLDTPADGRAAVERWQAMGPWVDRHVAGIRAGITDGRVTPRALVDKVIEELDDLLARPIESWPLAAPAWVDRPDWPADDRRAFADDLTAAVRDSIQPAFARQRVFLADELRERARSNDEPGLCHVPGGDAAYARLIRAHTSLDLAADEIHEIGLAEVARIDAEFEDVGGRVLGAPDRSATLDRLRTDPALHFSSSAEVQATAEAALARANEAIPRWFGRLPVAPCEVVVMGAHESKHSTIAYYRQPAADGSRPGQYFLNTSLPETRPRYEAETLAFHESVPGHHLQIAIAQELDGLPAFRRFAGPTAFIEGWGLYIERLASDMGLYSGELDRFGILSFDAWRACRLVVDTGMHAMGWSRDRAIAFMVEHTALAENNIVNEVDRYIAIPAQALAYKLGQLEFLRLRAMATETLGDGFDIREFHDAVLGEGAVGLQTLSGMVDGWIAARRRS